MSVAEKLPTQIEIWTTCSGCGGRGEVEERSQVITKAALPKHMAEHAYTVDPDTKTTIGADCDCPRKPVVTTRRCINCAGSGEELKVLKIPAKGSPVSIRDGRLLTTIFGEGDEPDQPGTVFDVQTPDEHHLELRTGIGVRVTWDRLNRNGSIPKGKQVELWTFDLTEVKAA